jgi:hypothetical protein
MAERDLTDPVGLCLRLNEALRRQIKQAAEDSERSMNAEILYRLRRSLKFSSSRFRMTHLPRGRRGVGA